jgi:hypothetical protein
VEQWRAIPGFEGFYEVSDLGRVRSLERDEPYRRRPGSFLRRRPARLLALSRGSNGYLTVLLRGKTHTVHTLVLKAFVGPRPAGLCCCHFPDPSPANNQLSNLRWDTYAANNAERRMPSREAS